MATRPRDPELADRLVQLRTIAGFGGRRRRAFARAVGVDHRVVERWEKANPPSGVEVHEVVGALAARLSWITDTRAVATWVLHGGEKPECLRGSRAVPGKGSATTVALRPDDNTSRYP